MDVTRPIPLGAARRWGPALAAFALTFAVSIPVFGAESARELFDRGVERFDAGDYQAAYDAFERSYAAKPKASVMRNMGVCLVELGKIDRAAHALELALAERRGPLDADTRTSVSKAIDDLKAKTGSVVVDIVSDEPASETRAPELTVDGRGLEPGEERALYLLPGRHRIVATTGGQWLGQVTFDAAAGVHGRKVRLRVTSRSVTDQNAGDSDVGELFVESSNRDAEVFVDGQRRGHPPLRERLPTGSHDVVLESRGQREKREVDVRRGQSTTLHIEIHDGASGQAETPSPLERRIAYVAVDLALASERRTWAPLMGDPGEPTRAMGALGIRLAGGIYMPADLATELIVEAGGMRPVSTYFPLGSGGQEASIRSSWLSFGPGIRYASMGKFGGTAGAAFLIRLERTVAELPSATGPNVDLDGRAAAGAIVLDGGAVARWSNEFATSLKLLFDVHGVGRVRDRATEDRLFLDSPAVRLGLVLGARFDFGTRKNTPGLSREID